MAVAALGQARSRKRSGRRGGNAVWTTFGENLAIATAALACWLLGIRSGRKDTLAGRTDRSLLAILGRCLARLIDRGIRLRSRRAGLGVGRLAGLSRLAALDRGCRGGRDEFQLGLDHRQRASAEAGCAMGAEQAHRMAVRATEAGATT